MVVIIIQHTRALGCGRSSPIYARAGKVRRFLLPQPNQAMGRREEPMAPAVRREAEEDWGPLARYRAPT
jgi:hypothetical protein